MECYRRNLVASIAAVICLSALGNRAAAEVVCLEAEWGTPSGQWKVVSDRWAAKGKSVEGFARTGGLTLELDVKEPGTYYVWARILVSRGFQVACDGKELGELNAQPEVHWEGYVGRWSWCCVATKKGAQGIDLGRGKHRFHFAGDEAGCLDRVLLMPLPLVKDSPYLARLGPPTYYRNPNVSTERGIFSLCATQHFDLGELISKDEYVVSYFYTRVESPQRRKVNILYGSDDSLMIFLNGKMIHENFVERRSASPGRDVVPITLEKGVNDLLLKIENGHGGYEFYVLLADDRQNLVPDLKFSDGQGRSGSLPVWSMIGPFPDGPGRNGFWQALGPEKERNFAAQYEGLRGKVSWRPAPEPQNSGLLAKCRAEMAAAGLLEQQDYEKDGGKPLPDWMTRFDDASMGQPKHTYYIAPDGDDNNPGTEQQPWKSLLKAAATLEAGQCAQVKSGTYEAKRGTKLVIVGGRPGEPASYVHYQAAPGAEVTLKGIVFQLDGLRSSYTHIKGFRFLGGGIRGRYWLHHAVVDDCEFSDRSDFSLDGQELVIRRVKMHGNRFGLALGHSHSVLVEDSVFDNNQRSYGSQEYRGPRGNNTDGINSAEGATKLLIRRCIMARHGDGGVDLKCLDHPGLQVIIEDSVAYENLHYGFKIWNPDSKLVNCVAAWNNWANLNQLYDLYNCTIVGSNRAKTNIAFRGANKDRSVRNTIFANCEIDAESYLQSKTADNLFFNAGEGKIARALLTQHFDLGRVFGNCEARIAYFRTVVRAPEAREVRFFMGTDDSMKFFVNGQQVHRTALVARSAQPEQERFSGKLAQGDNILLVKLENFHRGWGFCFCMTDAEGNVLDDVSFRDELGRQSQTWPVWAAIGTFPSSQEASQRPAFFDQTFPPEVEPFRADAEYQGAEESRIRWQKLVWNAAPQRECLIQRLRIGKQSPAQGQGNLKNLWTGDLVSDPRFVAPQSGDFRLAAGSPAIAAGKPDGAPEKDIVRSPRKGRPDLGAYQSGASTFVRLEPGQKGAPRSLSP